MDIKKATSVFGALSQETRLNVLRSLVQAGRTGLAAGELSGKLGIPHNTLSFHLSHLSNAGIVASQKRGRSIFYFADFEIISELIKFLVKDCCSSESAYCKQDEKQASTVIRLKNCCHMPSKPKN